MHLAILQMVYLWTIRNMHNDTNKPGKVKIVSDIVDIIFIETILKKKKIPTISLFNSPVPDTMNLQLFHYDSKMSSQ